MPAARRDASDEAWCALYGREAHEAALKATQGVLRLPFPPEERDDGEETLSALAASGDPRRWPWQVAQPLRSPEEAAAALASHSEAAAMPFTSSASTARLSASAALRSKTPIGARQ